MPGLPASALARSTAAAPAPAQSQLATVRVVVPRRYTEQQRWKEICKKPVLALQSIMDRTDHFGDMAWK
eukprot:10085647-Alexandrium_andersonii.AAC.1